MTQPTSCSSTHRPGSARMRNAKRILLIAALVAISLVSGTATAHLRHASPASYSTPLLDPFGSAPAIAAPTGPLTSVIVGAAVTKGGLGAVFATADGSVYATGNAQLFGSMDGRALNAPIVGIALTPDDQGYWLVAADGGIFTFGNATFYGSMGGTVLNAPIVGIASTSDGAGYWLVAADGGIFTFGNATFYGSMGGKHLNAAVVGMQPSSSGAGYWLVAADGGIFTFGNATFYGSMGGTPLNAPVMGMTPSPDGKGYWLVGNDGGLFSFGDATFHGSLGAQIPNTPISAILGAPGIDGYWMLSPDSATYAFAPTPTERQLPDSGMIVKAVASQIGPATQGNFCNPYGPCEQWCALFAAWAWNQGGVAAVSDGFTGDLYDWAAQNTSVIGPDQAPAAGDIVFYGTGPQSTSSSVHDGIVVQTWPDGSMVTVEGDSGPGPDGWLGVTVNGPFMAQRSLESNGAPIYGYGEPT
ncbi:MAG: CHAP domain-containing protein [Actinomycetota bacterium]|nr:CHAP domain-containing protein [Actinomycetota bacterium]